MDRFQRKQKRLMPEKGTSEPNAVLQNALHNIKDALTKKKNIDSETLNEPMLRREWKINLTFATPFKMFKVEFP